MGLECDKPSTNWRNSISIFPNGRSRSLGLMLGAAWISRTERCHRENGHLYYTYIDWCIYICMWVYICVGIIYIYIIYMGVYIHIYIHTDNRVYIYG